MRNATTKSVRKQYYFTEYDLRNHLRETSEKIKSKIHFQLY